MTTRHVGRLAALLVVLLLAACSAGPDRSVQAALQALPVPSTTTTTTAPPDPTTCDPHQPGTYVPSAPPPVSMPVPGNMPVGSSMRDIQDAHKLKVGVDQNTLKLGYFNPQDGFEGFEIDLAHEMARAIFGDPTKVDLRAIVSSARTDAISHGTVDVVIDAFTVSCKREAQLGADQAHPHAFSSLYYLAHQRLLVRSDSRAQNLDDLDARPVCVTKDGTADAFLTNYSKVNAAKPRPDRAIDRSDCLARLQEGTDDAVLADDAILAGFTAQDPYVHVVGPEVGYTDEPYGIAVNPQRADLVGFINGVLDQLRADGTLQDRARFWGLPSQQIPFATGCIAIRHDNDVDSCVPEYSEGS